MSCNRENVTWQSADGTWSVGFYEFYSVDTHKEDWDYEWDVEYGSDFHWVSTGHRTEDQARDSWSGANPGGTMIYEHTPANAADCARFDQMACDCRERARAAGVSQWPR